MFIERNKLTDIADKIGTWLKPDGFECLDLDWDASSRTLRVYVDHSNGVGFDECATVSSRLVEIEELDLLIPCEFNLEVSSPGIERPLRTGEHFHKAFLAKASVDIKLTEKVNNRKKGVGVITEFNAEQITLKTAEGIWAFPLSAVAKAFQLADWDEVAKNAKDA